MMNHALPQPNIRRIIVAALAATLIAALGTPPGVTIESPPPLIEISSTTLTTDGPGAVTMTVVNPGADPVEGVAVTDTLHHTSSATAATADRGAYEPDTGTWLVGRLGPGEAATLTLYP